jgi:5'-nucleotidase (lipoprotein e(P4) family)
MLRILSVLATLFVLPTSAFAADGLETRWFRDSVEYMTLAQQTYRMALQAVEAEEKQHKNWAVVLDVDETVLDNSAYQLERHAYGDSFDMKTWNAWCERRAAQPVPGVKTFLDAVRKLGGNIVFISNRHVVTEQATIDTLQAQNLWSKGDIICLKTDDEAYTKVVRRTEARTGQGDCMVKGKEMAILAYLGDNIHDFPEDGEEVQEGGRDAQFGTKYFLFANPMYGSWSRKPTRPMTP